MVRLKIILISGTAGSGKDTVGEILQDALTADGYKVLVTHFADLVKYVCREFCGWNGIKDIAGRSMMQNVGTDIVRKWDEDYWVRFLVDMLSLFGHQYDYVLIPDARFPNEVIKIKEKWPDAVHLRIERAAFQSHLTEEQRHHSSETALNGMEPDYYIHNDSTLSDLAFQISDFLANEYVKEQLDGQSTMDEWMESAYITQEGGK